jgi:alkaline phosphatase D
VFKNFDPFWEFVIGPVHAGAFGPGELDPSFGSSYEFLRAAGTEEPPLPQNLPPPNLHSFGMVDVSHDGQLKVNVSST